MKTNAILTASGVILFFLPAPFVNGQQTTSHEASSPIYKLTVVERTAKAINYQYRQGPTMIDFAGTVILPHAKGDAVVESRQGRTEIDAKLEGLESPQRYGTEFVTYVLWAITPEGGPHNIGELIPNGGNKAKIHVTTDLQAFALIVTAEPYAAVRQPGSIVVAENQVRPDTLGTIEPLEAKYELLPRGEYTWQTPSGPPPAGTHMVSMHEYEAEIELYQAQNAIGAASSADADRYAPDTLAKARQWLTTAQQLHDRKIDYREVVQNARQATQEAEDAREIAVRRQQDEQLQASTREVSRMRAELASAQDAKQQAFDQAQRIQAQADAEQTQLQAHAQAEAALAERAEAAAEASAAASRQSAERVQRQEAVRDQQQSAVQQLSNNQREQRASVLGDLQNILPTLDTSRGLVVTVADEGFQRAELRGRAVGQVARIAAIVSRNPGLRVSVQGYSDNADKDGLSQERADAVRRALIGSGLAANAVAAEGLGDGRPVASNSTAQGRRENTRVEIVVTGEAIGSLPLWDGIYPVSSLRRP